jgi:hypothetical protein
MGLTARIAFPHPEVLTFSRTGLEGCQLFGRVPGITCTHLRGPKKRPTPL